MHSVMSWKTFLLHFLARPLNIELFFGQGTTEWLITTPCLPERS
jgi:hypothetical protein